MPNKRLNTLIKSSNVPGAAVAATQKGEIVTHIAGVTNKNTPQKITDDTVFEVASLSKPVFAYIVLKMVERGQLKLDQPLHEISPEFGPPHLRQHPYYKQLTVRNILSHQAGLPNWFKPGEPEDYVAKPGQGFNYSGLAFCFLNEVVEKVSGKSLEKLAQEEFKKLKMNHSSFILYKNQANHAVGHDTNGNPDVKQNQPDQSRVNPAASLVTTADDYAKFLSACANDQFIRKYMFQPQIALKDNDKKAIEAGVSSQYLGQLWWGIGMGLQKTADGSFIAFHWGDNETNRSLAAINLKTNQAAVCLTNSANGPSVFRQTIQPFVGDISALSHWLAGREGLKLHAEPKPKLVAEIGLFKKVADKHLEENRHEDPKLQHEYDKRFGLIPKK